MKKKFLFSLFIVSAFALVFVSSCKKKDDTSTPQSLDSQSSTHNDDANYYKSESDQADNDVTTDMTNHPGFFPKHSENNHVQGGFCGVTVDTTQIASKILTYNFDGVTICGGRTRSGSIKVQLTNGAHWTDSGAVLTFTYTNFKVTRINPSKSITFNGTKTLTNNTNAANLIGFYLLGTGTVKYTERAFNVNVKFDNGLQATWNTAHVAQWSDVSWAYTFSCDGDTLINGHKVSAWGVNRFGQTFVTYYTTPIVCTGACGWWEPKSGILVHLVNNNTITLTLGVNSDGTLYAGSGCPWGFNVAWVLSNGNNGSANFRYY